MKKFISVLAMVLASTVHAADTPPVEFPILGVSDHMMDLLVESNTEELCAAAAYSFTLCDVNMYNTVSVIIQYRDIAKTRACERGYDQGYEEAEAKLVELPKAHREAVSSCQYRYLGE